MFEVLDAIAILFIVLVAYLFITQIIIPIAINRPIFPALRRAEDKPILAEVHEFQEQQLKKEIDIAQWQKRELELERELLEIRRDIQKIKETDTSDTIHAVRNEDRTTK